MKRITVCLFPIVLLAATPSSATAAVHLWDINEIYSNADGSVQFVELIVPTTGAGSNGEYFFKDEQLRSVALMHTFRFPEDLPMTFPTGGRTVLIATPGFAALPGAVPPDFTLDSANFFSTVADTIRFAPATGASYDFVSFTSGQLPTDGIMSINRLRVPAVNSPKNFAGQVGSLTPLTPGDIDGDGDVDRSDAVVLVGNYGRSPANRMQGDLSGDMTVGLADAIELQKRLVAPVGTSTAPVPEPATAGLAIAFATAAGIFAVYRRAARRQLQSRA